MSTTTTRLGLYKPAADGSELVNVVTDLNNNLDSLDAKIGAFACTSGTRPGSPYDGQMIRETDTGKLMLWSASASAWQQILFNTATWANPLTMSGGDLLITGSGAVLIVRTGGGTAFDAKNSGDTQSRWSINTSGGMEWGAGGASPRDTTLYRAGADTLKTDDAFQVGGALTVAGASSLADLNLSGSLNIGSARYRTQLSVATTVANTASETVIAAMTIPANDAVVGAVYRVAVRALASVTGTPTLTARARIGGVAGNLLTTATGLVLTNASNHTNHTWYAELYYQIVSTGAGGTGRGFLEVRDALALGGTLPFTVLRVGADGSAANVTHDTTAAKDLVITVQWSAASASNTTTAFVVTSERVA